MKYKFVSLEIKRFIALFCIIASSCLLLSGCYGPRYSEDEANEVVKQGTALMEDWIKMNCPYGKIVEINHYDLMYPSGPWYLTDYVTGTMNDGHTDRGFAANIKTGAVWLRPDDDMLEEFVECSKEYYLKSLDLPSDTIFGDSFHTGLCYRPLREGSFDSTADAFFEYYGLPGELVLQNGDVKEYVNNPDRGATIYYNGWIEQLPESFSLESYTFDDLKQRQEKYNIKCDYIVLKSKIEQFSYSYLNYLHYEKWEYEEIGDVLLKNRSVYRRTEKEHGIVKTNEYTFNAQEGVQIEKTDKGYRITVDPWAKNVEFQLMVKAGNPMLDHEYKRVWEDGTERNCYWDECDEGFRLEDNKGAIMSFSSTTELIIR